jgi:hypothetical protein
VVTTKSNKTGRGGYLLVRLRRALKDILGMSFDLTHSMLGIKRFKGDVTTINQLGPRLEGVYLDFIVEALTRECTKV